MKDRISILLTNDDGIHAPGIHTLHDALAAIARVEVVAPENQCSATGHAVSVWSKMSYRTIHLESGFRGHSLTGMPADCVKLAIRELFSEKPDLIISGINKGSNIGNNILYSGTVAAALEGAMLGVPSIAVSLDCSHSAESPHYQTAARIMADLVPFVLEKGLPNGTILNINVPDRPLSEISGIAITRQGKGMFVDVMEPTIEDNAILGYRNVGEVMIYTQDDEDSDDAALRNGFISITPLHYDLTHHAFRDNMRDWMAQGGFPTIPGKSE